jgi:protocatechuate 3,4-dioxygenase, beta subunit
MTKTPPTSFEYARESLEAHPAPYSRNYLFTHKRAPLRPLQMISPTLTELTGPSFGEESLIAHDDDLTRQHEGEPIGERIVVCGRVLDEGGRGEPNTLLEIWQANAAGRYAHDVDQHDAPLDPNFTGRGRVLTDDAGRYRFLTIKPGAYPVSGLDNVWRPSHIHLSLFGPSFLSRLVTQMYFPGDPLLEFDTIFNTAPEHSRPAMVASLDRTETRSEWALAYRFDIVIRGRRKTHRQDEHHV